MGSPTGIRTAVDMLEAAKIRRLGIDLFQEDSMSTIAAALEYSKEFRRSLDAPRRDSIPCDGKVPCNAISRRYGFAGERIAWVEAVGSIRADDYVVVHLLSGRVCRGLARHFLPGYMIER